MGAFSFTSCMQDMGAISDVATLCEVLSHRFGGSTVSLNDRVMHAPHACTPGNGSRWVSAPMWPQLIDTTPKTKPKTDAKASPEDAKSNSEHSSRTTASEGHQKNTTGQGNSRKTAGKTTTAVQSLRFELVKCPYAAPRVCTISGYKSNAQLERCTLQLDEAAAVVFERTCTGTHLSHVTFQGMQHRPALFLLMNNVRHP